MLARIVAMSAVSILKETSDPFFETPALPSLFGSCRRSGENAARRDSATSRDLVEMRISALHFFKVNIVRPRRNLELALWADPDARSYSSKPRGSARRAPSLFVERAVYFAVPLS